MTGAHVDAELALGAGAFQAGRRAEDMIQQDDLACGTAEKIAEDIRVILYLLGKKCFAIHSAHDLQLRIVVSVLRFVIDRTQFV